MISKELRKEHLKCSPFSQDDIMKVRDIPAAKLIEPSDRSTEELEKWIYISSMSNSQECFFFINKYLVGWLELS